MSASRDTGSSAAVLWAAGILGDVQWKQLPLRCGVLARNQSNCEQGTKEQCHGNIERERGSFKFVLHGFLLPGKKSPMEAVYQAAAITSHQWRQIILRNGS